MRAARVTLPEWGFKQEEVSCQFDDDPSDSNNLWNIELHVNPKLPASGKGAYKANFLQDLIAINVGMWKSNNALTVNPDKEPDALTSSPYHWPLMLRGLRMCGWGDSQIKYYLLGNPIICWLALASLVILTTTLIVYQIRKQRGKVDFENQSISV